MKQVRTAIYTITEVDKPSVSYDKIFGFEDLTEDEALAFITDEITNTYNTAHPDSTAKITVKLKPLTLGIPKYLVQTKHDIDAVITAIQACDTFSFDTETTSLDFTTCELVGASLCDGVSSWYIPISHITDEEQISQPTFIDAVKPILTDKEKFTKILQNLKFDAHVMKWTCGIQIEAPVVDTLIADWLVNENNEHGLKKMAKRMFKYEQTPFTKVVGKKTSFREVDLLTATEYGADDAIVTFRAMQFLAPKIESDGLTRVFFEVEMPFVRVLQEMEDTGFDIDADYLREKGKWIDSELDVIREEIRTQFGRDINLNSGKQLADLFFVELGYPVLSRTAKGAPKTDRATLEALARRGLPIALKINRYKMLEKIRGTYVEGLLSRLCKDGRVRGAFNHTGTVTGRLSSSDPNLQNIPSRDKETVIKKAFIAPEGYKLINADYSQIELRVMAHFSKDEIMIQAYKDGRDLHAQTASQLSGIAYDVFQTAKEHDSQGVPLTELDKQALSLRSKAKSVNFGIIYGRGYKSLAESENMSEPEAKKYIDDYYKNFHTVKTFIEDTHKLTKKYGYLRTLTGRKRRLPTIYAEDKGVQASAMRQSVNSKIQGSAGDIVKLAMIKLFYDVLPKYNAKLISQVHDELIVECPDEFVEPCLKDMREVMIHAMELAVPLDVDIRACQNWAEGH